ncbi:glutathione synthase [Aquaspirillum sp. LM1]|jgi:glutathione synthase|uniref:glutathione synthase n=1 Tax=Aquaspirillum sp. LM1 TaxID=1938604 RepID=UPI000983AA07|nr:glutathione synthase [Aquaspirillum sp. LM1]AQR65998.1 glutathione synthase [Aquaspirillum sp. LM1]
MRIAFIADPLASFKIYKDSTFAMMEEASRRGHALYALQADDLYVAAGQVRAQVSPITLTGQADAWFVRGAPSDCALNEFDAVLMRKDPPFDAQYLYATHLLSLAESQGARVFNRGQALRDYNEKLAILKFPEWTAPTLVSQQPAILRAFVAEQGDTILKPLDSMGGDGIFRVSPHDPNLSVILETMTERGQRTIMAQRYLPEIVDGDKRVLLIDGEPVPYCLARIPQPGETRGNLAAGGRGEARPLTARDRAIAEALGPRLKAEGLLLVGLDVIGERLTEVNVTSPTCFREIMDQTGCNVAGLLLDALERQCVA